MLKEPARSLDGLVARSPQHRTQGSEAAKAPATWNFPNGQGTRLQTPGTLARELGELQEPWEEIDDLFERLRLCCVVVRSLRVSDWEWHAGSAERVGVQVRAGQR